MKVASFVALLGCIWGFSYPQPSLAQTPTCQDVVQVYWQDILKGNTTGAFSYLSPAVHFHWPGNTTLLPMAGDWHGPQGVGAFFGMVGKYFQLNFCDGAPPVVLGVTPTMAYAYWYECNPLQGTTTIPCPRNMNQAQYQCDSDGKIESIMVNLDNQCVASALCGFTTSGAASLQCAAPAGFV